MTDSVVSGERTTRGCIRPPFPERDRATHHNLTRDAQAITTNGKAMTKLSLATNSSWRDTEGNVEESSEFHAVVCVGRIAEVAALHCHKGRRVYVEGRLRTRQYAADDGGRRFTTEVIADTVRLLEPRRAAAEAPEVGEATA